MRIFKAYIIPGIVLIISILVMNSGGYLKKSFSPRDNVVFHMKELKGDILRDDWIKADSELKKLKSAWKVVEKRVQFSVERDEMISIDTSLARIGAEVMVHDKANAIIDLTELSQHWDELER